MRNSIDTIVSHCDACQRYKLIGRGHGQVAPQEAALIPWREVVVDLIGPWTLEINNQKYNFSALTMVDMVTYLVKVV